MKHNYFSKILLLGVMFSFYTGNAQDVGIGTENPQETLHIAGPNTIRVESFSTANNPLNNGVDLAPVYVDNKGNLTLTPPSYSLGMGLPINFLIDVPNFVPDNLLMLAPPYDKLGRVINNPSGVTYAEQFIYSVPFTAPQYCTIEVKYGLTFLMSSLDLTTVPPTSISDFKTRVIQTFFCIDINNDGLSPAEYANKYGFNGQSYSSDAGGALGYSYMNGQGFASLPPGTHALYFFGVVLDNPNVETYVGFGGASDYLKVRVYN